MRYYDPMGASDLVIRDQRHMVGPRTHTTPEEVQAAWQEWATTYGLRIRQRHGDWSTDLRRSTKTVHAYVSGGSWTGDCPGCNGGVPTWPGGHDLGCCLDCGTIYRIVYPPQADIDQAVDALKHRPREAMNWFPHRGEKPADLHAENKTLGLTVGEPLNAADARVRDLKLLLGANADQAIELLRREGMLS